MKTIDELLAEGVAGKRVFVRADLNVPLDGTTITDDGRIRAVQPTVARLADSRRAGHRRLAPRPSQGGPGPGLLAGPGRRPPG